MTKQDWLAEIGRRYSKTKGFSAYIGSRLAGNYAIGTRGEAAYRRRLEAGVQVATQTPDEELDSKIGRLIQDRADKGAEMDESVHQYRTSPAGKKRALILALWSVRIPKAKGDVVDLIDKQVYGDPLYMPPLA